MASVRHRLDNLASESETPRPTGPESSGTSFRSPSATARNGPVSDAFVNSPLAMRSSSVFPEPPSPFSARVVVVVSPRLSLPRRPHRRHRSHHRSRRRSRTHDHPSRVSTHLRDRRAPSRRRARGRERRHAGTVDRFSPHPRRRARSSRSSIARVATTRTSDENVRARAPSATDRGVTPLRASRRVVDVGRGDG